MSTATRIAMAAALVLLVAATACSAALASLPEGLPLASEKEPILASGSSGRVLIETASGTRLECQKGTGAGEATSPKLGKFVNKFEGCKESLGFTCSGLADPSGTISVEGQVHLWYGLLSEKLVTASVLLPQERHVTCSGGLVLLILSGCSAGLISETNKPLKTLKVAFLQTKGHDDITRVRNEKGEWIECILKLSKNEGALEQFAEEGTAELKGFKQNSKEIEVEIMS
jgi:hypothetical protein